MSGVFRTEHTYVLGPDRADRLEQAIARRLPPKTHAGRHECWTRTVYLDSRCRELSRQILQNPTRSTKLRVRSYLGAGASSDPGVWVEVKHRRGLVVAKTRFQTTLSALPALLRGGTPPERSDQAEFARVRGLRGLIPTVVVDYRRRSYESADSALRLTFDADITARQVEPDYFSRAQLAPRAGDGWAALGDGRVFEAKVRGSIARVPRWLRELLLDIEPTGFSKAAAALRSVTAVSVA